nr:dopamine D5 [gorilla, Peptide Partial, 15 aa] [Gorilla gorilla]
HRDQAASWGGLDLPN